MRAHPQLQLQPRKRPIYHFALVLSMALLNACSTDTERLSEQVIAKVDGVELTIHQLDRASLKLPAQLNEQEKQEARRQLQKKLIQRQLAVRQAQLLGLDRDPDLMMELEEHRLDALARAYAERIRTELPAPPADTAERYFNQHPELFSARKIYRLRELNVDKSVAQLQELKTRLASGQSSAEIAAWLNKGKARYDWQTSIRAAEQLPIAALAELQKRDAGQRAIFESPSSLYIYEILDVQAAPIDKATALPQIVQFLQYRQLSETMDKKMQSLQVVASIEERKLR
jgi:EpsD family peptidyl-prolyl cis-trans isomerase